MPDKYKQIIEDHEIELTKKITLIKERHKKIERFICLIGTIIITILFLLLLIF